MKDTSPAAQDAVGAALQRVAISRAALVPLVDWAQVRRPLRLRVKKARGGVRDTGPLLLTKRCRLREGLHR